jgi:hypothetical protein
MAGNKTHEQHLRTLERKPDLPGSGAPAEPAGTPRQADREARQSEFPVSRGGMNQESDHNKHNDPGQSGHKREPHSPDQEKR